jgi:hypothetical protein
MNPRFQLQRELLGHLVAVGAIGQSHFIAAMQLIDAAEAKLEEDWAAQRQRDREEWAARPWWRKLFTFDRKP